MGESTEVLVSYRKFEELLSSVFSVIDGARLLRAEYANFDLKNVYLEEWTCNVEESSLLVFDFFGELIHAGAIYTALWHVSRVAKESGLVDFVINAKKTLARCGIICDSAFGAWTKDMIGNAMRARKTDETKEMFAMKEIYAVELIN